MYRRLKQVAGSWQLVVRAVVLTTSYWLLTTPAPAALTVSNGVGPTNVLTTSAFLTGAITGTNGYSAGGNVVTATVFYGQANGLTNAANWSSSTNIVATLTNGAVFTVRVTNLTSGVLYFYRTRATESNATAWASSSTNFFTTAGTPSPVTPGSSISLVVNTNGAVQAPTNFWAANAGTIAAIVGTVTPFNSNAANAIIGSTNALRIAAEVGLSNTLLSAAGAISNSLANTTNVIALSALKTSTGAALGYVPVYRGTAVVWEAQSGTQTNINLGTGVPIYRGAQLTTNKFASLASANSKLTITSDGTLITFTDAAIGNGEAGTLSAFTLTGNGTQTGSAPVWRQHSSDSGNGIVISNNVDGTFISSEVAGGLRPLALGGWGDISITNLHVPVNTGESEISLTPSGVSIGYDGTPSLTPFNDTISLPLTFRARDGDDNVHPLELRWYAAGGDLVATNLYTGQGFLVWSTGNDGGNAITTYSGDGSLRVVRSHVVNSAYGSNDTLSITVSNGTPLAKLALNDGSSLTGLVVTGYATTAQAVTISNIAVTASNLAASITSVGSATNCINCISNIVTAVSNTSGTNAFAFLNGTGTLTFGTVQAGQMSKSTNQNVFAGQTNLVTFTQSDTTTVYVVNNTATGSFSNLVAGLYNASGFVPIYGSGQSDLCLTTNGLLWIGLGEWDNYAGANATNGLPFSRRVWLPAGTVLGLGAKLSSTGTIIANTTWLTNAVHFRLEFINP